MGWQLGHRPRCCGGLDPWTAYGMHKKRTGCTKPPGKFFCWERNDTRKESAEILFPIKIKFSLLCPCLLHRSTLLLFTLSISSADDCPVASIAQAGQQSHRLFAHPSASVSLLLFILFLLLFDGWLLQSHKIAMDSGKFPGGRETGGRTAARRRAAVLLLRK